MCASILAHSSVGEKETILGQGQVSSCVFSPHIDLYRLLGSPLSLVQLLLPEPDVVNLWWFL